MRLMEKLKFLLSIAVLISSLLLSQIRGLSTEDKYKERRERLKGNWLKTNTSLHMTKCEDDWLNNIEHEAISVRADLPACVRKEYRCLTTRERQAFHDALNLMKKNLVDKEMGSTEYDVMTMKHRLNYAPAAHLGPAFLPFHRQHLCVFERILRRINPTICLPYWDSTLDSYLPNPAHSLLWTPSYLGTGFGVIDSGFMSGWKASPYECQDIGFYLERECGNDQTLLFSDYKIMDFLYRRSFASAMTPQDTYFEEVHGDVHLYVGGHLGELLCSPNDPVFYMHHSFVDNIWEEFRRRHPRDPYPDTDMEFNRFWEPLYPYYDRTVGSVYYDTNYTTKYYRYALRPYYCKRQADCCNSEALWCDTVKKRCKAKVKEGGDCTDLHHNACHCGKPYTTSYCLNGVCKCYRGCMRDDECPSGYWCDTEVSRCTVKQPLYKPCTAVDLPNNACYGSCPETSKPMCYKFYCHCIRLL